MGEGEREDVRMCRCEDVKMICADVKKRGWEDEKRWEDDMCRCEDEKMWRWEDVKMRRWCVDVKMRRWENDMCRCEEAEEEKMWRWEDDMRRVEDEKMWRWENDMCRCEDMKMINVNRPPLLEEPFAQTLSGKKQNMRIHTLCATRSMWHAWCVCIEESREPHAPVYETASLYRKVLLETTACCYQTTWSWRMWLMACFDTYCCLPHRVDTLERLNRDTRCNQACRVHEEVAKGDNATGGAHTSRQGFLQVLWV